MQIVDRVPDCNGCSACIVGCYDRTIEMKKDPKTGNKYPRVKENGCSKCNNCILYCPLYLPVELPTFTQYFAYDRTYYERDMPKIYRETMRDAKAGKHIHFTGPLCQVAALQALLGDTIPPNLTILPLACDPGHPDRPECARCHFW